MTYDKKNSENNAICGIAFWFDETAMVIFWEWNYWRFSTSNFIVEVTTFDTTWKAISRENIFMLSRTWNQFTVWTRAVEKVPIDDDQTTNIQQALPFVKTNTVMKQVISKKLLDELQDETIRLENEKLNITDFQKQTAIYASSSTWNDSYAITLDPIPTSLISLKWVIYFLSDIWNTWSATLNINSLWAKVIKKLHDQDLETWDIEASQKVWVVYNSINDVFEMISQTAIINVEVNKTVSVFITWENITQYDALYLHTDWKVYKTDSTNLAKMNFIWIATETISIWLNIKVNTLWVSNFSSWLTIWATYYPNNVVTNANLTQLVTDNESEWVWITWATWWSWYRTAHYMKFTTWNKAITLTSAKIWYHMVSSQNQWWRYYYVSARILADNAWVPNKASVIWQLSTYQAFADTQNTTSSYTATWSISLSANTTYWLDAMVYFDAYIVWTTYIKVLYKNVKVSWNIHWTENLRTAWPYVEDTNDLYYDITFADWNVLWNISTNPPLLNIVPIWNAIATDKLFLLSNWLKSQALITPTVWASPYTYKNITWKQIIVSITWWTTSLIQISRDNSTFYQVWTVSNIEVVLWINDYLKITYTVAPVLKIFTF